MKKMLSVAAILAVFLAAPAWAETYELDPSHTNLGFSVRHLVISNVKGKFQSFTGSFSLDEKKKKLTDAYAVIQAESIDTDHEKRDKHLRSPDFFDVKKHPQIRFKMHRVVDHSRDGSMKIEGDLTIKGITKRVKLTGKFLGTAKDPWGNKRAGFTARGEINRKDFGLNWNKVLETGGLVVGDEVTLELEIEGIARSKT